VRRLLPLLSVVLALLPATLSGAAAQDGTPAAPAPAQAHLARTNVRYFVPVDQDGLSPRLHLAANERGTCIGGSVADAGRPDAWRCTAGNAILDPCFASPFSLPDDPGVLVCADSPFADEVIPFTPTAPLPAATGMTPDLTASQLPWALELANGERCTLLSGATVGIAGMRLNYGCAGHGSVVGEIDRSQPFWAVSYLPESGVATSLVEVTAAWS
jgi:hypothetical protein